MANRTHISIAVEPQYAELVAVCGEPIPDAEFDQEWFEPGQKFELPTNTLRFCGECFNGLRLAAEMPGVFYICLARKKAA